MLFFRGNAFKREMFPKHSKTHTGTRPKNKELQPWMLL